MSTMPLTNLLKITSKAAFERATKHPFLEAAGKGELPKEKLSQWLAQDRLYAQAYVRFIGAMLTKVVLPNNKQHMFDILVEALNNIQRELEFFDEVAMEYGLDITALSNQQSENQHSGASYFRPSFITRAYIDLFMSVSSPGVSLVEGMAVLYATEYVYLHAWKHAAGIMSHTAASCETLASPASFSTGAERDLDGGALRRKFIPNWSSPEFEKFVNRIGEVVDELAACIKGADVIETNRNQCIGWWRQILWLEEQFWPDVNEH
ncbi:transcription regulator PAB1642, putative [Talaromyces stipitatus ATCC 10500]|uniref:Transcription regulator PAB1642, putative n=1 Tax=Talaromyces stipitatus (strain ATCC 10500 / CBS 375.48 / QM 6759 / NRRL 1006) TaxID=441959 RepID=B8M806_TALSN|nr:transcription regulator PAB1642, putative [Talaromyces stipitatus ATCC 10500]EED19968.1 transcription regulator PAB1642, putative [Talaromyces stipitatus ATCC 10500]